MTLYIMHISFKQKKLIMHINHRETQTTNYMYISNHQEHHTTNKLHAILLNPFSLTFHVLNMTFEVVHVI